MNTPIRFGLCLLLPAALASGALANSICVEETALAGAGGSGLAFGHAVAVDGDLAVVCGDLEAYAYSWSGGAWTQEAVLTIPGAESGFGASVDLSGDTAVIGLALQDGALADSGRVLVFVRGGGVWSLEAELIPADVDLDDHFGTAVAIEGDRALVGSPGDDDAGANGGSVYVFERTGSVWAEATKIVPAAGTIRFGTSLALSGGSALIGGAHFQGGVFVYVENGGIWSEEAALASTLLLPSDVAIDGDRAVVGGLIAGLVFERSGSLWSETDQLATTASTVALAGPVIVVGGASCPSQPAARVYVDDGSTWVASADLDLAGSRLPVAISGLRVLVGTRSGLACAGGDASSFDLILAPPPTLAYRNAGTNPTSYAATPASIGETIFMSVLPSTTGHTHGLVIGFDSPFQLTLGGGQTLLCLDLLGNGELVNTGFQPGPIAQFQLHLPNDPSLIGFGLYTQGLHAFGAVPFALTNAQDIVIGGCN